MICFAAAGNPACLSPASALALLSQGTREKEETLPHTPGTEGRPEHVLHEELVSASHSSMVQFNCRPAAASIQSAISIASQSKASFASDGPQLVGLRTNTPLQGGSANPPGRRLTDFRIDK
nr:hypothetical protein CFP56_22535 [Quercus suber]